MKKLLVFGAALLVAGILTGCGGPKVYNIDKQPVSVAAKYTQEDIFNVIKEAGYRRGWIITKVSEGKALGKIDVRGKHLAYIDIAYTAKDFSITYKDSENLKYDAESGTIHKNYNSWVRNLQRDIEFKLSTLQ